MGELEKEWKEKLAEWDKHMRAKLPKWFVRGPARSPETPSPLTMRTRDRLRHLRALKRRRRRKRRNKRGATVLQEELPNHLDNCSLHSQPVDCDLKNKYFVFILSSTFQLKQISITYLRNVCQLHIN